MNNLEREIELAILQTDRAYTGTGSGNDDINQLEAKAAAQVAMKWIKLAFIDGDKCYDFILWAKEKGLDPFAGLTPTEPDTKEDPAEYKRRFHSTVIGSNGLTDPPNETQKV